MKPRSLRHRLEKMAKLLVVVQKHTPDVECLANEDKGESGHLVVDFVSSVLSQSAITNLGKDLEGKGYKFTKKNNPWLGQITYTGRGNDKPTIIFTLPIAKDRAAINEESVEIAYSFRN